MRLAGLIAAVALLASSGAATASGGAPEVTYHGSLVAPAPPGTVDIAYEPGSRKISTTTSVTLQCEDGTTRTTAYPLRGRADVKGRFLLQDFSNYGVGQYYVELAGRLMKKRASGTFYYINLSRAPEVTPSCATPTQELWTAKRP